jgi:hypothetical protein
MKIEKIIEKYGWPILGFTLMFWITVVSFFNCTTKDTTKIVEKHIVVDIKRDYHNNSIHPIEPLFKITLEDSLSVKTTNYYNVGDTVTYVIYTLKK